MRDLGSILLLALLARPRRALLEAQPKEAGHETITLDVPPSYRPGQGKLPDLDVAVKVIHDQTNAFRKEEGRAAVTPNKELTAAAQYFAEYMADNDRYGHEADEKKPAECAVKHGYVYCIVLENIAYQYSSVGFAGEELGGYFFEGWKKSPGHRKNMLDPDVTESSAAVAFSKKTGHYYAVQMFGRPKIQQIEFRISNDTDDAVTYQLGERKFDLPAGFTRTHQECRPPTVTFAGAEAPIQPKAGEQFHIEKTGKGLAIKKGG